MTNIKLFERVKEKTAEKVVSTMKNNVKEESGHSFMKVLEHTLSGEMYHAILTLFITPHITLKLFLLVFIFVSHGLAAYTMITLVLTFLEYGVTTTVRTVYETPTTFPKITVCNVNQFSTRYAFELVQNISQQNQMNVLNNLDIKNLSRYNKSIIMSTFTNIVFGTINSLSDSDKKRLGHSLNDILLSCSFNYDACKADDFSWMISTLITVIAIVLIRV